MDPDFSRNTQYIPVTKMQSRSYETPFVMYVSEYCFIVIFFILPFQGNTYQRCISNRGRRPRLLYMSPFGD